MSKYSEMEIFVVFALSFFMGGMIGYSVPRPGQSEKKELGEQKAQTHVPADQNAAWSFRIDADGTILRQQTLGSASSAEWTAVGHLQVLDKEGNDLLEPAP